MQSKYYSKYHSKKTEIDGIVFDSKKEATRYQTLKNLEQGGVISDLRRQVKFVLVPARWEEVPRYGKNGQRLKDKHRIVEREVAYYADFVYHDNQQNVLVVEDTKGVKTPEYIIKRKLMFYRFGIRIQEV